jgi:hypothetical protein
MPSISTEAMLLPGNNKQAKKPMNTIMARKMFVFIVIIVLCVNDIIFSHKNKKKGKEYKLFAKLFNWRIPKTTESRRR